MHFVQQDFSSELLIRGYGDDGIRVGSETYCHSLILTHERVIVDWRPQRHDDLSACDFECFGDMQADILLLGTGPVLKFPPPAFTAPLLAAGVGVEIMDTAAACRTFNILLAEGRPVIAALLLG